jgi:hypothetical protein
MQTANVYFCKHSRILQTAQPQALRQLGYQHSQPITTHRCRFLCLHGMHLSRWHSVSLTTMHRSSLCPQPRLTITEIISVPQTCKPQRLLPALYNLGPTGLDSSFDLMSANNSLYSSPASSSSSVANGFTGQGRAFPTSRRNSFDMVIATANDRAATATRSNATTQALVGDSGSHNSARGACTSRDRNSASFEVESQTWKDSFEDVELQDQLWPTASRLAAMRPGLHVVSHSDATATAFAFQKQAQSGKASIWKEWAPYFGL